MSLLLIFCIDVSSRPQMEPSLFDSTSSRGGAKMDVFIGLKSTIPGGGATNGNCTNADADRGPGAVATAGFFLARSERPLGGESTCVGATAAASRRFVLHGGVAGAGVDGVAAHAKPRRCSSASCSMSAAFQRTSGFVRQRLALGAMLPYCIPLPCCATASSQIISLH